MTSQTRHGSGHDWDDARKSALFADIVSLKLSIEEAASLHGLRVDVIQEWLRLFRRSALLAFDERLKKTLIDQGANADALTAAEFTGHIEDVSIADLVQTIEIAGKDAVITVTHEGTDSHMWCSAGAIIDAESGPLAGDAAVYRILGFERGRMVADLRPEPRVRTIYAATHRLLIEALRRKDEADTLEQKLGAEHFFRLGERSTSSRVHVSTDELAVLRLFDGPRRLHQIVEQSPLGDLETLMAIDRLVADGYLVECEAPKVAPRRPQSTAQDFDQTLKLEATLKLDPTERSSTLDARDGADTSSAAPTSFVPMAVSQRPDTNRERGAPRWVFAAIAAAVLAPAAFWFGETMSNLRAARQARADEASAARAAAAASVDPALLGEANLALSTTVEPPQATIWLDRHPVATGHIDIELPMDGRMHELRVAADGYIPTTLLFTDVPPPREIRLERLPTSAPEREPAPTAPAPAPTPPGAVPGARGEAKIVPGPNVPASVKARPASTAPARRRTESSLLVPTPSPIASAPREPRGVQAGGPQVQIIDDNGPKVRVIE